MKKSIFNFIALLLIVTSCSIRNDLNYENRFYKLVLNNKTGSIKSIEKNGKNMVYTPDSEDPLFTIRFRDTSKNGEIHEFNALQAQKCNIVSKKDLITLSYSHFKGTDLLVVVTVNISEESQFMHWNIAVNNNTGFLIDHIDFPNIVVPNDLVGNGGEARIFWPGQEGVVVEDIRIREEGPLKYSAIEYPNIGWGGLYPSSTQMQYMAYYSSEGGLYVAAHDENCNPKGIEFHRISENGIKFDYRLLIAGAGKGWYKMPYDMIVGTFDGDWYDASDIYRDWVESSKIMRPPKIANNKMLPDWYIESPVVVTYPIRGHKDLGDMTPNELYPYANALEIINKLNRDFNSKIMALLMHWEGSAPWAPPYVWPPFGGEKIYLEFVNELHKKGNLTGLYASGIGYTLRSNTDTTYNMYKEYAELQLEKVMKVAPDGGLSITGVCAGPKAQRIGHDMCPANQFVKKVVINQINKIIKSNTDYIQYFDQNLGGGCYACYGTSHGHGYGGGVWQNEAMIDIYKDLMSILAASKNKPLIGCEAAAAEPFYPYLLFNDLRATINLAAGIPVPAYSFINHEYVNNFMGNQNGVTNTIDVEKCPMNYLQRLAYAFTSGDMFTVILRGNGDMLWSWGTDWEAAVPNQEQIKELIKNLNSWRLGVGKNFLVYGRMLKPFKFEGATNIPMISKPGNRNINFPSVFSSNWQFGRDHRAQFFVNYLPILQEISFDRGDMKDIEIFTGASDTQGVIINDKEVKLKISPMSAIMVSYSNQIT